MNRENRPFQRRTVLKTIGVGAVGGTVLTGSAAAGHGDGTAVATVDLKPINEDAGGNVISGEVTIEDDGSSLAVSGTAEGLDPSNVPFDTNIAFCGDSTGYLSLFYDKASSPEGPEACEPGVGVRHSIAARADNDPDNDPEEHPNSLTVPEMIAGKWVDFDDGEGTIERLQSLEGTIPIDTDDDGVPDTCVEFSIPSAYVPVSEIGTMSIRDHRINDGFGTDAVVACGKVKHSPDNDS